MTSISSIKSIAHKFIIQKFPKNLVKSVSGSNNGNVLMSFSQARVTSLHNFRMLKVIVQNQLPIASYTIKSFKTVYYFRNLKRGVLIGSLSGIFVSSSEKTPNDSSVIKAADDLYEKAEYDGIYKLLINYKDSKNDELLWRLGRATYEKARASQNDAEKKLLYREALDYVEAALSINYQNFAVHKWMAILIDYVYAYEGTKARISQSYIVKEHMLKACELNPTDGTSRHLLGLWYYNVAEIPWYQRKVASVIFSTPPSATYQDALDEFLHAEKVEPNFYSQNYLYIAKCYLKLGKEEDAKLYLEKTMLYPSKTKDDNEAIAEATKLYATLT